MNPEEFISEITQSQKSSTIWFYLHDESKVRKFIEVVKKTIDALLQWYEKEGKGLEDNNFNFPK